MSSYAHKSALGAPVDMQDYDISIIY